MEAALVTHQELTYHDVDRLCKRHLADRTRIALSGPHLVRYERSESQRFKPAYPHVSAYLLERIDFDRAFRRLPLRHRQVLFAWYGTPQSTQAELAEEWGCSPKTVRRRRSEAVEALRELLNE